jgi:hypothetical protein
MLRLNALGLSAILAAGTAFAVWVLGFNTTGYWYIASSNSRWGYPGGASGASSSSSSSTPRASGMG